MATLLQKVKQNLILTYTDDDTLIQGYITAATAYAEEYQHLDSGYYDENDMSATTEQAVVMLASFFYESRDGSAAGFFSSYSGSSEQVWDTVNLLLRLDRNWKV